MIKLNRRMWAWPWELRSNGVLGINQRNLNLLFAHNPRSHYRLVDDKIQTKQICQVKDIAVPETYEIIERFGDSRYLTEILEPYPDFVVKPAEGSGGRGILVITDHDGRSFCTVKGKTLSLNELRYHIHSTLSGLFSLGGQPDRVLIEQRIVPHPLFQAITLQGTPDIRVVVYQSQPVAAMLRLPTQASRGRANLHQGAVGAGLNMHTGRTVAGVYKNRAVSTHPDTGSPIVGLSLPGWAETLDMAVRLAQAVALPYLGVDIVLDQILGPLVLEANVRPGLAIQIANQMGLLPAIHRIEGLCRQN